MATSWQDVFQNAESNAEDIGDHFWTYFFPAVQQEIVNRIGLIEDLVEDPSRAGSLLNEFLDFVGGAVDGHFTHFVPPDDASYLYGSVDEDHLTYFDSFMDALGGSGDSSLQSLLDFFASSFSGVLLGNFTYLIGSALQLGDDISDIIESIGDGDLVGAFQNLSETPVNLMDAFLNGYGEVDVSIPVSDVIPGLKSDATITSINIGGVLSPAGSLFESLGISGDGSIPDASGEPVGTLGSLVSMQEAIAVSLGWDGLGNPLDNIGGLFDGSA
jgi:hypothetical protein